jgi:hypothetical protein
MQVRRSVVVLGVFEVRPAHQLSSLGNLKFGAMPV